MIDMTNGGECRRCGAVLPAIRHGELCLACRDQYLGDRETEPREDEEESVDAE